MSRTTCFLIFVILVGIIWYAPHYLTYADKPVKSDVVVLFVGYDYNARKKEAMKLIEEGYAQHIIVPAFRTMYSHSIMDKSTQVTRLEGPVNPAGKRTYPRYFEDTHVEVIEAKQMMDKAGLRSAIFVSSPFQMRRIKTITGKVFDNSFRIMSFVPTRYARKSDTFWLLNNRAIENVTNEYIKMTWFLTYGMFNR